MTAQVHTLTTDRLVMRPPVMADFEAYHTFYASAGTRHIGGARDLAAAWGLFAADVGHWALKGFGWWTVLSRTRPVGSVGFHHPPHQADLEIGWNIYGGATGKGYGAEAARAALTWGWATLGVARIVSCIDLANTASIRLAERIGAVHSGDMAAHDPACGVWHHPRPQVAA